MIFIFPQPHVTQWRISLLFEGIQTQVVEVRDVVGSPCTGVVLQCVTVGWCGPVRREGSTLKILCGPTLTKPWGWKHWANGPRLKTFPRN